MSDTYLNNTGLAYFWGKIKAWCNSIFALDSDVVHKTGDETINGKKTFTFSEVIDGSGNYLPSHKLHYKSLDSAIGDVYTDDHHRYIRFDFQDKNDFRLGGLEYCFRANGAYDIKIGALKSDGSGTMALVRVGYDANGVAFTSCPSPSSASDSSDKIATTEWIRTATGNTSLNASTASDLASGAILSVAKGGTGASSLDSADIVTKTGTQEITGFKTFNTNAFNANIRVFNGDLSWSSVPSSTINRYFAFCSTTGEYTSVVQERNLSNGRQIALRALQYGSSDAISAAPSVYFWISYPSGDLFFSPSPTNKINLGNTTARWDTLHCKNSPNVSSDERIKRDIETIPDKVLDLWGKVEWIQYRLNDSYAEKGERARIHTGIIAQRLQKVFSGTEADLDRYGLFCYSSWEAKEPEYDENGELADPGCSAGDEYSIRYEEALCIEAAYMRRENARLKKRVADLEERLAALELKVS